MDFITNLDGVPLTRETRLKLQRIAQTESLSEEAQAGYAIEQWVKNEGEHRLRAAEAKRTAALHVVHKDIG